jgi:hypothetical protein
MLLVISNVRLRSAAVCVVDTALRGALAPSRHPVAALPDDLREAHVPAPREGAELANRPAVRPVRVPVAAYRCSTGRRTAIRRDSTAGDPDAGRRGALASSAHAIAPAARR